MWQCYLHIKCIFSRCESLIAHLRFLSSSEIVSCRPSTLTVRLLNSSFSSSIDRTIRRTFCKTFIGLDRYKWLEILMKNVLHDTWDTKGKSRTTYQRMNSFQELSCKSPVTPPVVYFGSFQTFKQSTWTKATRRKWYCLCFSNTWILT